MPDTASPASFRYRFGSLMQAYRLIAYDVPVARLLETRRRIQNMVAADAAIAAEVPRPASPRSSPRQGRRAANLQIQRGCALCALPNTKQRLRGSRDR